ncbi:MAG: hydantoinase/oxoprolinase family protein [Candidatus Puniceispirillales bacterium]|tara:strand:- start:1838 stop:3907 length:2070 start_codon:yes stop_codon:yes gene_type:complete
MKHDTSISKNFNVLGIDVGGTFTDLIYVDKENNIIEFAKVPTSSENQAFGVMDAIKKAKLKLDQVKLIVHGTTTTTNALLERKLSKTGLITTKGFKDVIELGRRTRPNSYGMHGKFVPIISRDLRCEVSERVDARGNVITVLDEIEVKNTAEKLLELGCESIVIHFLHSYANNHHELRALEIISNFWPNNYITMGHSLLSENREYERGVTAVINASVQPILEKYLKKLENELSIANYKNELLVMNGNGGTISSKMVVNEAAKTVMSGPASGVIAAAHTGQSSGINNIITYDMGGTSTDVALIIGNQPSVSSDLEVEYGMPVHVPMVDVRTVGAGGGSIAKLSLAGLLEVGPESAGSVPGPICYGHGGTIPTISDANLLLGRLNISKIISDTDKISIDDIKKIFHNKLSKGLLLDEIKTAEAVIKIANTKMAGAIRMVSISLGVDPRDFTLFAFGGAGPLHASSLAKELGIPKVLIPARPGITNALGCVVADLRQDFTKTLNMPIDKVNIQDLHSLFEDQEKRGIESIKKQGLELTNISSSFSLDMQFIGQTHILRIDLPNSYPDKDYLQKSFEKSYLNRFKVRLSEIKANIVNANTTVQGHKVPFDISLLNNKLDKRLNLNDALLEYRKVYFKDKFLSTPIYSRDRMPFEFEIKGPAIIEQMDTTTLIEPNDRVYGDNLGNMFIEVGES